jgi:alpha-L-glutamate ligase-like protein
MWHTIKQLSTSGVLGINKRNADYTLRYNPRRLYPLVDDKLRTKQLASAAGIPVPALYQVVAFYGQIKTVPAILTNYPDFVIKPAKGSHGDGIWVFSGQRKNKYRKVSGTYVSQDELLYHISNIISGVYSLGGQPDKAMIEYRIQFDPIFAAISYLGAPDIRIIVFLGVPVMAMVRLPTRASDGKANLHQGAIGVGLNLATGKTLSAVWYNEIIEEHPDTGNPVAGLQLPSWTRLLELAAQCYDLTGLGYLGVDFVLDKEKGPMLLEINARPGLNIQIANHEGLLKRLKLVEQHHAELHTNAERSAFAKTHFGVTNN